MSEATINRKIKYAIAKQLRARNYLYARAYQLATEIQAFIVDRLIESETYASLVGGTLRADFGLDDSEIANLPNVVYSLISVEVNFKDAVGHKGKLGNELRVFEMQVGIVPKFNTSYGRKAIHNAIVGAQYYSNEHLIDWLTWLLFGGVEVMVEDYKVTYLPGRGRSEMAVMRGPNGYHTFEVDPEFAGTPNNNWVTRILDANRAAIIDMIKDTVKAVL